MHFEADASIVCSTEVLVLFHLMVVFRVHFTDTLLLCKVEVLDVQPRDVLSLHKRIFQNPYEGISSEGRYRYDTELLFVLAQEEHMVI